MTRQEIEKRIEEIKDNRFMLKMKDHWTNDTYDYDLELKRELKKLEEMLDK